MEGGDVAAGGMSPPRKKGRKLPWGDSTGAGPVATTPTPTPAGPTSSSPSPKVLESSPSPSPNPSGSPSPAVAELIPNPDPSTQTEPLEDELLDESDSETEDEQSPSFFDVNPWHPANRKDPHEEWTSMVNAGLKQKQ